ncbi:MAG: hypothetical protein M3131_07620 [Actinomycetota bacterium]|nr:hypothetical protein [Actinomycetota bacterium]
MLLALLVLALVALVLAGPVIARTVSRRRTRRIAERRGALDPKDLAYDPGRERRAEHRARQLLRSCVNEEEWAMYRDLGFIRLAGRHLRDDRRAADLRRPPYAYLIYPHRPIVTYVPETGQLLSEYCVEFPDVSGDGRTRLPASDDVLAKWMALTSDETRVIGQANMHLVGRQLDPQRVRRDLWRLAEWQRRRDDPRSVRTRSA